MVSDVKLPSMGSIESGSTLIALAIVAYLLYRFSTATADITKTVSTSIGNTVDAIKSIGVSNPISDTVNTSIGGVVGDPDFTLGGAIYDATHTTSLTPVGPATVAPQPGIDVTAPNVYQQIPVAASAGNTGSVGGGW